MRTVVCAAGAAVLCAAITLAQSLPPGKAAPKPASGTQWFPPAQMTTVGVYYYPEAWPESQWARDIANIKKFGFEFIHMGEFAWYFMEPDEGRYQFEWLERVVKLASAQGLKVVLCTPSATPPIWLVRKHPEVLMVDAKGRRMNHGSREHADWSSPVYRQYVERINTELAKRFGNNPAVWGWQIDNELSHYGAGYSYSPAALTKFRSWLREKHGTVERLNRDWGNAFWSQMYQNFDQIELPNPSELPQQVNPHALLDFQRWFADEAADYLRFQAATLRRHTKDQWITTNYMSMFNAVDPTRAAADLDIHTWTHYPVHGNLGETGFRMGDPNEQAFMWNQMRSLNGYSGIMELQPGQVNWGDINPWPQPGAIRLWIWRAFAAGAQLVCTYRYRQPISGGELYHKGIVEPDGVTLSPGGEEYSKAAHEIAELRAKRNAAAKLPNELAARRTAFFISYDSRWDIDNHKQTTRWDTTGHWFRYVRALQSMQAPVDVITVRHNLQGYPFFLVPAAQLADPELLASAREYVEAGGNLILTARTGHKDMRGHLWEGPWAQPILDLIGATIPQYDLLPGNITGGVRIGASGPEYKWGSWAERLEPKQGTTVLARYTDQLFTGKAAAITRKLGSGTVTYIGVDTLDGEFERTLLRQIYAGTKPANLAPGFSVEWRDGFYVATNYTSKPQPIPAGANAKLLLGTREVPTAGVTVWTE